MSDTKDKVMQVLNDNYMINLFSANAREHIANKIVDSLNGSYVNKEAPENTVAIKPEDLVEKESKSDKSEKVSVKNKRPVKNTSKRVGVKRSPKPSVKRGGLKNLSQS
jgi:hypothetical protein